MAKKKRILIKLISSSGHFYTTYKNKNTKLLIIKKYDPNVNKRSIYKEKKINK